jgi:transposase
VGYLPRVWLAPAKIRELRQLVNHRQRLVDHGRNLKLQVGGVLREQRVKIAKDRGSRWSKAWLASVRDNAGLSEHARWIVNELLDDLTYSQQRIRQAEQRLRIATLGDAVVEKLMRQPGIGEVTAWVLRAFIGEFGRFKTSRQLSRFCGLSPCNASSGQKLADAGLIQGCNRVLRCTIVQAGHRLIRTIPRWAELAESMRARGKPACVIVAAVCNRWLRNLHHAMKDPQADRCSDEVNRVEP